MTVAFHDMPKRDVHLGFAQLDSMHVCQLLRTRDCRKPHLLHGMRHTTAYGGKQMGVGYDIGLMYNPTVRNVREYMNGLLN